ncbi:hypothetical protein EDB84DRAFT_1471821 [Lactarius hengduanensis]|nr:hypothetical protein EDB84DRAFT_1471821 [Lactarius hengduanensis]
MSPYASDSSARILSFAALGSHHAFPFRPPEQRPPMVSAELNYVLHSLCIFFVPFYTWRDFDICQSAARYYFPDIFFRNRIQSAPLKNANIMPLHYSTSLGVPNIRTSCLDGLRPADDAREEESQLALHIYCGSRGSRTDLFCPPRLESFLEGWCLSKVVCNCGYELREFSGRPSCPMYHRGCVYRHHSFVIRGCHPFSQWL